MDGATNSHLTLSIRLLRLNKQCETEVSTRSMSDLLEKTLKNDVADIEVDKKKSNNVIFPRVTGQC